MFICTVSFCQSTWISPVQSNWNNPANWAPAGVPGPGSTVIFTGATTGNCVLDIAPVISAIQMTGTYTGQIIMNGNTLTVNGAVANVLNGGSFSGGGVASSLLITSTNVVPFDGTDTDANVAVTATLTSPNGVFSGTANTTFGGPVIVTAHSILLNGSTYNGLTVLTKSSVSAPTNSLGNGGNTFNGLTTLVNDMDAIFRTGNTNPDVFNSQLTLSLTGSSATCDLQVAFASAGNLFNGNVRVRSDPNIALESSEISFGAGGGTSTLASGFTIDEVTPGHNQPGDNEFEFGDLIINNLTQLGNTTQSINLRAIDPSIDDLRLYISNSTFNATVNYQASNPYVSNSTFNGVTTLTKTTGTGTDVSFGPPPNSAFTWDGGNTFNNTTTIRNLAQCTLVLGGTNGDTFNGPVTFHSNQAISHFMIATNGTTSFRNSITITRSVGTPTVEFGHNGGSVVLDGSAAQTISSDVSVPTFSNLTIQNASGITLNIPIVISTNLDLVSGIITPTGANYVSFLNDATVTNAKNSSFIDGIVRKTGNDAFTFPIGDEGAYHPLGISAPTNATSEFSAEYFLGDHGAGSVADGGMVKVSDCEFWLLNRLVGTDNNVSATLYWNEPSSFCHTDYITPGFENQLQVARWSGALWNNLGQSNLQGPAADGTDGNFATSGALPDANAHALTFGSLVVQNMLPITLVSFDVIHIKDGAQVVWQTATEHNNEFFTIERMQKSEFVPIARMRGAGTTNAPQDYQWTDHKPLSGLSYYRLKQTDFNGTSSYSEVVALEILRDGTPYPNPVKDILHLDGLSVDDDSNITITDVTGRRVYSGPATQSLDVENLIPGIYHLAVTSKSSVKWYSIKKE